MRRIVAIVEGQTEEHFIRKTYPSALVLRPFTNGKFVPVSVIAKKIALPLAKIGNDFDDFLIILDREKRNITSSELADEMLKELSNLCPGRKFSIGIPDIHIENWILADEIEMQRTFSPEFQYSGDGVPAKGLLKEISGISHSPIARAELLKSCCALRIAENSPSFAEFRSQVRCDWYWIKKAAA